MRSKEDYQKAIDASASLVDMCKYFNILPMGGNFDTMKHAIARYNLDTSHFINKVILHENHGKKFNRNKINKQILIATYGYACSNSECKLSTWDGERLVLQVDHIDGNNTNDAIENLRLLCPNCHSRTETFCMPSTLDNARSIVCECGKAKQRASKKCSDCIKPDKKLVLQKPKKYKKEVLENIVKDSVSYSDVLRKMGKKGGDSRAIIINAIHYYEIDTTHFTGQAWSKGKSIKDNPKSKQAWKNKLILERGYKCESCQNTHWINNTLIPLELEHIDGNNKNNVEDNLKLLCSNCHSQTKSWKRKKSALAKTEKICLDCDKVVLQKSERCLECYQKYRVKNSKPQNKSTYVYQGYSPKKNTCKCGAAKLKKSPQCEKCHKATLERIVWPSTEELIAMVEETSFLATARVLGVSDNAIRKRIKNHPV